MGNRELYREVWREVWREVSRATWTPAAASGEELKPHTTVASRASRAPRLWLVSCAPEGCIVLGFGRWLGCDVRIDRARPCPSGPVVRAYPLSPELISL